MCVRPGGETWDVSGHVTADARVAASEGAGVDSYCVNTRFLERS